MAENGMNCKMMDKGKARKMRRRAKKKRVEK